MTDNLANLLMDHPFADDRDLLCTIDGTVSAGRAREMARATATRLLASGLEPGHGVAVRLPTGPELVTTMVGIWLGGRGLRTDQRPLSGGRGHARRRDHPAAHDHR